MDDSHISVDLMDLIDADASVLENGDYYLQFPAHNIGFSFRTANPDAPILESLATYTHCILGHYRDGLLFVGYTDDPGKINTISQHLYNSLVKSFPGEKMTVMPLQVLEANNQQAVVQLHHRPEVCLVLTYDHTGALVVSDLSKHN